MVDFLNYFLSFVGQFVTLLFGLTSVDGYSLGYLILGISIMGTVLAGTVGAVTIVSNRLNAASRGGGRHGSDPD